MPEDCHALTHKVTESGSGVPREVRHIIAAFVNGSPGTFDMIPEDAQYLSFIKEMWSVVQRWELSVFLDGVTRKSIDRITIYFKTDKRSLCFLNSLGAGHSLIYRDPEGRWGEEIDPENERDGVAYHPDLVDGYCDELIYEVTARDREKLHSRFSFLETRHTKREFNRLHILKHGAAFFQDEDTDEDTDDDTDFEDSDLEFE
jgi:hypothetical protein